jgi:lambda repressor-like predicted transcriptional regulator
MKKLQAQLKTISKSLVSLSRQVDTIFQQISKLQAPQTTAAAKKTKATAAKAKTSSIKKKPVKKETAKHMTALEAVLGVIKRSKNGATIAGLKEKTGLVSRQLSNALYKLTKKGQIMAKERGLYIKK